MNRRFYPPACKPSGLEAEPEADRKCLQGKLSDPSNNRIENDLSKKEREFVWKPKKVMD
jgi:hypothetical protein